VFLTLCICALCALQVAMHTFEKVPRASVEAARVALLNVLKLLWLMMMDSFGRDVVNVCSTFYLWKVVFLAANVSTEAVITTLFSSYSPQDLAVTWTFDGVFIVWLLVLARRSKKYLGQQPYLRTRTRQLGFRFFWYQSSVVVIALVICLVIEAVTHKNILSGVTWIQHTYMILLGYVHLPVDQRQHSHQRFHRELTHGHCSFAAAKMCLLASYEVYQDKPFESPDSEDTKQWIDCGGWSMPKSIRVLDVLNLPAVGIQVVIASCSLPSMTIVAFRGTANWKNIASDLATWRVAPDRFGTGSRPKCLSRHSVLVHKGFWSAYQSIRDNLLHALRQHYRPENKEITSLRDEDHPGPIDEPIVFTGHSLGGALATLAALDNVTLLEPMHSITACFTFGSPRVGSYSFASLFDEKVPDTMRMVFERDFVTDQPKFFCAFKHVGREILIDEQGNCIAQPTFVEKAFFDSRTRIRDHSLIQYVKGFNACAMSDDADEEV